MKKIFLYIFFALVAISGSIAQISNIKFERISGEQGLSQNDIVCIYQDREGFIWFGTQNGLNKYDGYKIKTYYNNPDEPTTIADAYITTIFEDKSGVLWIGTKSKGLCMYNKRKDSFVNYKFDSKNPNTLSDNNIRCIFQDSRGILWIGTNDGLNKCVLEGAVDPAQKRTTDNSEIKEIETVSPSSDSEYVYLDNSFQGLWDSSYSVDNVEVKDGKEIHVIDGVGSIVLESEGEEDEKYGEIEYEEEPKPSNGSNGTVEGEYTPVNPFFQSKNLLFIHYKHNSRIPNGLTSSVINKIIEVPNGNLLIATDAGLSEFDPRIEKSVSLKQGLVDDDNNPDKIQAVYMDKKGNLWIGTDKGLKVVSKETGNIITYKHDPNNIYSISDDNITSIIEDNYGILWIGTRSNGLNTFDRQTSKFFSYHRSESDLSSLSADNVSYLFIDRADILWVGTYLGGVNKWDRTAVGIELYRKNPFDINSLSSNQIRCIFQDSHSIMWVGTVDNGLNKWDIANNKFTHYKHDPDNDNSLSNNHIRSIIEDSNGHFWIGTDGGGIDILDPVTNIFKHYKADKNIKGSLSHNRVWKIYKDKQERIWVGTYGGGLNLYNPDNNTFTYFINDPDNPESISNNQITTIFEDHTGILWVGTYDGGLNQWDEDKNCFIHYTYQGPKTNSIGNDRIYSIIEDSEGTIWIGTKVSLNKFDRFEKKFIKYTTDNGLPDNTICGILEDNSGNLWISTNFGICRFNKRSENVRNYDVKNGLQSTEFLVGASFKAEDGKMYFGGVAGLNTFYPDSVRSNSHPPQVVITDFLIMGKSVVPGKDSPLKSSITTTKQITITHRQNNFTFEFAALHFSQPEKNLYKCMMENYDREWIQVEANKRDARYTNLDPGEYYFRVIAANSDGVWNNEGVRIKVIVLPPFYETWWFRSMMVIIIVLTFYIIYRSRVRTIEQQKEKLEVLVKQRTREVELQKEEIAAQKDDLEKQNSKIELQNEQIKSSIRYAQTIQNAILPMDDSIREAFEFFVIFRPKDIVSGDFFWFSKLSIDNKDVSFIATVDCTGHGVPGAFMSMIGNRLLNEIVLEKNVVDPGLILDELNLGVRKALKQDQTDNNEGMDVCLCRLQNIEDDKTLVIFAGAKRPLFYYEQGKESIKVLKGDRKSIGGIQSKLDNVPFTQHELILKPGDLVYLTTDGIIDQNSPDRVRFGTVKFLETIKQNVLLPIKVQKETLETTLDLYQRSAEQRDDITVIGIKI